ncbi:MAG: MBL fold metallo-hydrolase [Ilumatobacteraceae bacterium]
MTSQSSTSITALGAAGTVTGSKFLLRHRDVSVLFDCGMFQGGRDLRQRNWDEFDFDPAGLDADVFSHAHLDHCGLLPRLVRVGFRGTVHCTADTSRLMSVVLPDSGRIHEEDARHANKAGYSRHEPALPLYTEDDAWAALDLVRSHDFGHAVIVADGVRVTFSPAGHILGSAVTRIELDDGPTVVFSGDLGRPNHPLLMAPSGAGRCDHLFVEST